MEEEGNFSTWIYTQKL